MTDRKSSRTHHEPVPFVDDKLSEINDSMAQASARPKERKGGNPTELVAAYEKHQKINELSDIFDNIDALNP